MTTTNLYAPPGAAVADIVGLEASAELADRLTRFWAMILDGIILGAMVYLPALVTVWLGTNAAAADGSNPVFIAGSIITLIGLIAWCWLTITYVSRNGQSIAKKLLDIKVVRRDGSPASLSRIFWLRNVVNTLIGMIPFLGALYTIVDALFIFSESQQCLHDKIADTIVVKD
jgi:uncharacterized RDD family membrane protein YckC